MELLGPGFEPLASEEFDHLTPSGSVQRFHVARVGRVKT
jgi:hypothetical protein